MKCLIFILLLASSNCFFSQSLSVQTGSSSDFYFPKKSNNEFNRNFESYTDFLGLNISYSRTLDTLNHRKLNLFVDLYRLNFGTDVGSYPETEKMDFTKLSNAGVLSPSVGFLYGIPVLNTKRLSLFFQMGSSLRFNLFSMSASGTFHNEGADGVNYLVINELKKRTALSLSVNFANQLSFHINESTSLLITPLISIGSYGWYDQNYNYTIKKDVEILDQGINTMRNNGSRFQLLLGFDFKI